MFKSISEYEDRIKLYKKSIQDHRAFFEEKGNNQDRHVLDDKNYKNAYQTWQLWQLRDLSDGATEETQSENPIKHEALDMIERIYGELSEMLADVGNYVPSMKNMETELKKDLSGINLEIKDSKKMYDTAFNKYKLSRNTSSAARILKIDSYDRNIEENFYIMYYLLSYGFLGFFIYKLIKL